MAMYTSRQRVWASLNHQEADRVPMDLSGTLTTGINCKSYKGLCQRMGMNSSDIPLLQRSQMLARVDPVILGRFGVDFTDILLGPPDGWTDIEHGDGVFENEWGIVFHPAGDRSTHFPKIHPLRDLERTELRKYRWPDPRNPGRTRGLKQRAKELYETTDFALVGELSAFLLQQAQNLRGYDSFLEDLMMDRSFAEELLDILLDYYSSLAESFLGEVGPYIQVVTVGDDLGLQNSLMISPELYRSTIKPGQKRLIETIKRHTGAKVFFHTCGYVCDLIPDLIEIGVDILSPVQVASGAMGDTKRLKREFGRDLVFWGAVDTQHVLPFSNPAGVEAEVKRRLEDLAPGGGYVLAPVHNIQAEVPAANVEALYEAGMKWGRYAN